MCHCEGYVSQAVQWKSERVFCLEHGMIFQETDQLLEKFSVD